ncbi:unnamed protein product [Brassica rapa subsp. trilocularis]|uniref:decapping 5-like protein n=1 Tax=Brassica napus TaxID=3708 RepID=UPI0020790E02|nr:decapping 5-like protein [Brassica napus]
MEEIGSFVSIIRTDEARIEGILGEVDLPNQRIVVKNARNFGSEGRKLRGAQIPPSLFKGGCTTLGSRQIKDMEIILLSPQEKLPISFSAQDWSKEHGGWTFLLRDR